MKNMSGETETVVPRPQRSLFAPLAQRSLAWWIAIGMMLAVLPLAASSVVVHLFQSRPALAAFDDVAARYRDHVRPLAALQTRLWMAADAIESYVDTRDARHAAAFAASRTWIDATFAQLEHALADDPRLSSRVERADADWKVAAQRAGELGSHPNAIADPVEVARTEALDDETEASAGALGAVLADLAADLDADHARAAGAYARSRWIAALGALLSLICIVGGVAIIVRVMRISVDRLVTGARKFSAGDREHRIDVTVPPELRDIADELNRMIVQVRDAESTLAEQARRDVLTGLANRRAFEEALTAAFARLRRMNDPVVVVMVDVDYFKKINDTHGHAAGDAVLAAVGRTLAATIREVDAAFRVGGEEFAILLSGAGPEGALIAAERQREAIAANRISAGDAALAVTASFGVAVATDPRSSSDALLHAADGALYAAKAGGRNRVVVAAALPD